MLHDLIRRLFKPSIQPPIREFAIREEDGSIRSIYSGAKFSTTNSRGLEFVRTPHGEVAIYHQTKEGKDWTCVEGFYKGRGKPYGAIHLPTILVKQVPEHTKEDISNVLQREGYKGAIYFM